MGACLHMLLGRMMMPRADRLAGVVEKRGECQHPTWLTTLGKGGGRIAKATARRHAHQTRGLADALVEVVWIERTVKRSGVLGNSAW